LNVIRKSLEEVTAIVEEEPTKEDIDEVEAERPRPQRLRLLDGVAIQMPPVAYWGELDEHLREFQYVVFIYNTRRFFLILKRLFSTVSGWNA